MLEISNVETLAKICSVGWKIAIPCFDYFLTDDAATITYL